jgi:hypothetical protein
MATRVFYANDGNDRLIVSTIRTRLVFFHEAGVAVSSERKVRMRVVWWKPATWRGFQWRRSADAEQPRNLRCLFNGSVDPAAFGATAETSPGYFKLACDSLAIRRHCVWVAQGDGTPSADAASVDRRAADVRDVELHFDYGGEARTVRHAAVMGVVDAADSV